MIQNGFIILFKVIVFWTITAEYHKNFNKLLMFKTTLEMSYIQVQKKTIFYL